MADWSQPTLTTGYSAFLSAMQARDVDAATQFTGSTPTNVPDKAIRWSPANFRWEQYSTGSSTWSALTTNLAVNTVTLGGNPSAALQAAPKQYVDAGDAAVAAASLPRTGGSVSGAVTLTNGALAVEYTAGGADLLLGNWSTAGTVHVDVSTSGAAIYNVRLAFSGGTIAGGSGRLDITAGGGIGFSVRPTWVSGYVPWDSNNLPAPISAGNYGTWNGALPTAADLNAVTTAGWYQWVTTSTNSPASGSAGIVLVVSTDGTAATPAAARQVVQTALQSDGRTWTRRNVNNAGWSTWANLAAFSAVTNATGSRVLGTTYTNTGTGPMFVSVTAQPSTVGGTLLLYVDGTVVAKATASATYGVSLSAMVPAGKTYAGNYAGGSTWAISNWFETS